MKPAATNVTDETEKRLADRRLKWPRVFAARMLPALAARMKGLALVEVPLPSLVGLAPGAVKSFVVGARLFYREWLGGPTGRADLLTILEFTKEGNAAIVSRSFGWSRGKIDADLSELSLVVLNPEGVLPLVGDAVPEAAP